MKSCMLRKISSCIIFYNSSHHFMFLLTHKIVKFTGAHKSRHDINMTKAFHNTWDPNLTPIAVGSIGSNCTSHSDCSNAFNFSICNTSTSQCACSSGYYGNSIGSQCIARHVGDNCTTTTDCSSVVINSICVTTVGAAAATCQCVAGYQSVVNGSSCVERHLTDPCATTIDCSAAMNGSTCGANGTCTCVDGYQPIGLSTCSLSEWIVISMTRRTTGWNRINKSNWAS